MNQSAVVGLRGDTNVGIRFARHTGCNAFQIGWIYFTCPDRPWEDDWTNPLSATLTTVKVFAFVRRRSV